MTKKKQVKTKCFSCMLSINKIVFNLEIWIWSLFSAICLLYVLSFLKQS